MCIAQSDLQKSIQSALSAAVTSDGSIILPSADFDLSSSISVFDDRFCDLKDMEIATTKRTSKKRCITTISVTSTSGSSSTTSSGDEDEDNMSCNNNNKSRKKSKTKHNTSSPLSKTVTNITSKGFQRVFARHNYHDYSQMRPHDMELESGGSSSNVTTSSSSTSTGTKSSKGGVNNPFPVLLHRLMEDSEVKGFSNIISWQPHGRAFLIHDPKTFVADVLPLYFKHSKLSSFQRQLSLYGFVRLTSDGPDRGAYYHECFLRFRPFLCSKIQRTRIKGTWVRTSSSPESEPNFYLMEPVRATLDDEIDNNDYDDDYDDDDLVVEEGEGSPSSFVTDDEFSPVPVKQMLKKETPATPSSLPLFAAPVFPSFFVPPTQTTTTATPTLLTSYDDVPTLTDHDLDILLADVDLNIDFNANEIFPL